MKLTARFVLKETLFFNSASVLLNFFMNRALNVTQVLFDTCKHFHTKTFYIYYICIHVSTYNHFYNILRPFYVLPNFIFTTSETICVYYLQIWYIRVTSRVAEQLKIIRKIRKYQGSLKNYQNNNPASSTPPKRKPCQYWKNNN